MLELPVHRDDGFGMGGRESCRDISGPGHGMPGGCQWRGKVLFIGMFQKHHLVLSCSGLTPAECS